MRHAAAAHDNTGVACRGRVPPSRGSRLSQPTFEGSERSIPLRHNQRTSLSKHRPRLSPSIGTYSPGEGTDPVSGPSPAPAPALARSRLSGRQAPSHSCACRPCLGALLRHQSWRLRRHQSWWRRQHQSWRLRQRREHWYSTCTQPSHHNTAPSLVEHVNTAVPSSARRGSLILPPFALPRPWPSVATRGYPVRIFSWSSAALAVRRRLR